VCSNRNPIQCIVPPHIAKALAESKDRRLREIALRLLTTSARLRGRREILGKIRTALVGAATGGLHRTIYDAQHEADTPGQLVRDEGAPASADPAVNEAYDGLGATYKLYQEVFHRNSIDDHGMRLVASVHYDRDFDNAFFDGEQMVFGDGDNIIFVGFTKALDVIGHELTHGVTQFTAALEYKFQSGALNESFSDVFGSLVKQYHNQESAAEADWLIGKGILAPGIHGEALRSMKEPGSAYDDPKLGGKDPQPGTMNDFVHLPLSEDQGGVHINSGIPNHAFYLAATQMGGNAWEDAGAIWYQTLLQLWPKAQFQDCANVTAQVAGAQFGTGSPQQQAVKTAWEQVGIPVTAPHVPGRRKKAAATVTANGNGAELQRKLRKLSEVLQDTLKDIS
jgi:Zn-dependent metalloprotease